MPLDVRDVLNSFFHGSQGFAQCRFPLAERAPPQISTIAHEQIKSTGDRLEIPSAAVQGIEIRHTIGIEINHLSVDDG